MKGVFLANHYSGPNFPGEPGRQYDTNHTYTPTRAHAYTHEIQKGTFSKGEHQDITHQLPQLQLSLALEEGNMQPAHFQEEKPQ